MKRTVLVVAAVLALAGTAAGFSLVQPDFNGESDVDVRQLDWYTASDFVQTSGDTLNGYLNMSFNSFGSYFGSCASGEVAYGISDNGGHKCRQFFNPTENLSETLEAGNKAGDKDINMTGNNITDVSWLNPSRDWKTGGSIKQAVDQPFGIDFVQDNSLLDGAVDNDYSGGHLFVTATQSDRLTVADVDDPTNIRIVGSVQDSTDLSGAEAVKVAGRYAYVAARAADALTVVDVRDPSSPKVVGTVSSSADLDNVRDVDVEGGYAYLAAQNSNALTVVDVSDPASPSVVGTVSSSSDLDGPYGVEARGDYAYVSSDAGDSLTVVDISDPASPSIEGTVSDGTYMDRAFDVYLAGSRAYVTGYGGDSLAVVDISDPSVPEVLGGVTDQRLDGAVEVEGAGDTAYVVASFNESLTAVDVSDPGNPEVIDHLSTVVYSGVEGLSLAGPMAYTSNYGNDVIATSELTDVFAPAADVGNLNVGQLHVEESVQVENELEVSSGLNVGPGGVKSDGRISSESLEVTGSKNFVQAVNETHSVVYTSSESGEAVVEWSDTVNVSEGANSIGFPPHYRYVLSDEEDYHIFLQPRSFVDIEVVEKRKDGFLVEASGESTVDVHVRGVREGYEDTQPLRKR